MHVSIDGATPKPLSASAKRPIERVMRNVEGVLEARRRLDSAMPHLHMVMVIMRQNLHELPDLVRLAHRLEMEQIFVQHLSHDFSEFEPARAL